MKKAMALILTLAMAISLAACGGSGSSSTPPASGAASGGVASAAGKEKILMGLAMHNQSADWAVRFQEAFLEAAAEKDVEVTFTDANSVAATQVSNIEDLVSQNIDVLVVLPADYSALGQALKYADDNGVPIVNADSRVVKEDQPLVSSFISADNYKAGYTLGEYLADTLPEGATVGTLNKPEIAAIGDRFVGMEDAFKDKGRDDLIIAEKIVTDTNQAATYTEDMLMSTPEITTFVALNDGTALTCYATCKQLNREDVRVYGFDGSPAGKQSIADGEMAGTLVYSPVDLARASFEAAYAICTGADYEQDFQIPMWMISPENIAERDLKNWE
ncbi:sugar ABC transporter substrate-binding protein [Anaerofilum sp. BX8]|uniref:Sugar ABC transporter substrate-binding protein n=1 Tax=Anaerofilum hominis TaxID=2763016 RepID=A0A923RFG5_9FIRM|nr:sugar ABC transporter substrate-binding protein [Anaerofilum hominis]MBC5582469.1 sugar ABC transporter substrate-binding protein [Anaerofilum hominis]